MSLDPEKVRRSYDAVADKYAAALMRELDWKPLDRALLTVGGQLERAGLRVEAELERRPYAQEAETRRGYVLARRAEAEPSAARAVSGGR